MATASSVPPALAKSGAKPSTSSCSAPSSTVSGERMKLRPAYAINPMRSPRRSCIKHRDSRCARPSRDGTTSSASIDREISTASTIVRAFVSVVTVRRPKRGPANAALTNSAVTASAITPPRPVSRATAPMSSDQADARRTLADRAQIARPRNTNVITGAAYSTGTASNEIMGLGPLRSRRS